MDELQKGYAAMVMVQVEDFPGIVRKVGPEAGNHVLQKVTVHLLQGSDLKDIVAKAEDATFVFFLMNVKRRDVVARLQELNARLNGPLWLGGPSVSLSSGVAMLNEVETPEDGLQLARDRCQPLS